MAAAAPANVPVRRTVDKEKIVDFAPERLAAPFELRCAALFIDYLVLLALPVGWLVLSKFFSESGTPTGISGWIWFFSIVLFVCNFLLLPLLRGQTFGKMLTGLTILNTDGTTIDLMTIVRRHLLGYTVTVITFGIGFLISAVNKTGRSLHDFIAGTVVVRARKTIAQ